jgi:hypothetical protein
MAGAEKIIDDYDFTNCNFRSGAVKRFLSMFPKNKFSPEESDYIEITCAAHSISPLIILTKLETENNLVTCNQITNYEYRKRWALGCAMYTTINSNGVIIKPYAGFEKQIYTACKKLRDHFNSWRDGDIVYLNLDTIAVLPINAATYALHKYTPFWGEHRENGAHCSGNESFIVVFNNFKKIWKSVK